MDDTGIVDLVAAKLAELNARRKRIAGELAGAQAEAGSPVSEAWGEFRTLASMPPEEDTDDLRTRIRAALRRCVTEVRCLFVGRGITRLAALQVCFANGRLRNYVIGYYPKRAGRPAKWEVLSTSLAPEPGAFDLRNLKDVTKLERFLAKLDTSNLAT